MMLEVGGPAEQSKLAQRKTGTKPANRMKERQCFSSGFRDKRELSRLEGHALTGGLAGTKELQLARNGDS